MVPRLGEKYNLEIDTISNTRDYYRSTAYQATGQPVAPALLLEDERIVQGGPIGEEALEAAIQRHLQGK